jgi:hypothetical protein
LFARLHAIIATSDAGSLVKGARASIRHWYIILICNHWKVQFALQKSQTTMSQMGHSRLIPPILPAI